MSSHQVIDGKEIVTGAFYVLTDFQFMQRSRSNDARLEDAILRIDPGEQTDYLLNVIDAGSVVIYSKSFHLSANIRNWIAYIMHNIPNGKQLLNQWYCRSNQLGKQDILEVIATFLKTLIGDTRMRCFAQYNVKKMFRWY